MLVIAKERGYYGGKIQEEGDEFDIVSADALGKWMTATEPFEPKADKPKAVKKEPVKAAETAPADSVM